jgi:hypothetical protein
MKKIPKYVFWVAFSFTANRGQYVLTVIIGIFATCTFYLICGGFAGDVSVFVCLFHFCVSKLLDLPGIIEGAKDGKGRGRQVIAGESHR